MAKKKNGARVVRIVFLVMGLILLVAGAILTFVAYDFMNNALPVSGRVTSVEVIVSDESTSYKPTIRFVDFEGRKQSGQTFMSSSNYNFAVGSSIDVLYDTRNPESLRMETWFATWGFGIIFLAGSVIPFLIASVIGRGAKPKKTVKAKPKPQRARVVAHIEDDMVEVSARTKGLVTHESISDHKRETNYTPTVRRNR